ncbi:putative F-box/kelch-repeat protein [Cardamine amara subsp. amara]|uniref:F-box/kelch-repeat protein n=1 Tax=Cardamine amara subsp. amara TaxID=228776 RepID=A0ABD1A834_CARAN
MRVSRVGAKSWFLDGKLDICNRRMHKEELKTEESMNWGEVFDLKTQTWKPLPRPSDDGVDTNHKVAVFGARLYVNLSPSIKIMHMIRNKKAGWILWV